jgi:hypothetical protein
MQEINLRLISRKNIQTQISLTGSIQYVLSALIDQQNTAPKKAEDGGYSLGLGALGSNFNEIKEKLGEFCSTPQMAAYLTGGEVNVPVVQKGKSAQFFTPYNVSLGSEFDWIYKFNCLQEVTIKDLYLRLFAEFSRKTDYNGLIAVSLIFKIEKFFGSLVKYAPLKGKLPLGQKISDPENYHHWFSYDQEPVYQNKLAFSVGIGCDRANLSEGYRDFANNIFYVHPASAGSVDYQLHNHCFVLSGEDLPLKAEDYHSAAHELLNHYEIIDIKHIMDHSTLKAGFAAVNFPSEIMKLS